MQQKTHLATLDGLRGVAALAVVLFHFSLHWQSGVILPKAYLAVDFFFALSGFVIAKAYEGGLRQQQLSFHKFTKLRLQRLYPLIFLSMCFALAQELPRIAMHASLRNPHEILKLLAEFGSGILLLPYVLSVHGQIFPLNPPAWSLFYELVVNFFYAAIARHLTSWRLVALLVLPGLYLLHLSFVHGNADYGHFPIQFSAGVARVVFSFFMGVLLYRLRLRGKFSFLPRISGFWLAGALLLSFLPGEVYTPWFYDPLCIFLIYPLMIAIGSEDHLPVQAVPACLWLGRISYPLYVLHYPLIVRNGYHIFHLRHGAGLVAATSIAALACILVAWAALVLFDEPVRDRLKRGWRLKPATAPYALAHPPEN